MCSYRCLVRTLSLDANTAVARRQAGLGGTETQRRLRVRPGGGMLENNCSVRQCHDAMVRAADTVLDTGLAMAPFRWASPAQKESR